MGAKTDDFFNYITDVNTNFLTPKENYLIITHLFVEGFGWEDTVIIEEDLESFEVIEKFEDTLILLINQKGTNTKQIIKGYYN